MFTPFNNLRYNDTTNPQRNRSYDVHGAICRPTADAPRKEEADRRGTCDEDRCEADYDLRLGTIPVLPERDRLSKNCIRARSQESTRHSSRKLISKILCFLHRCLLTDYYVCDIITSVTLREQKSFPPPETRTEEPHFPAALSVTTSAGI